jgi:hypothetical protein
MRTRGEEISLNVAHELGFLQGQGKPVLLLIDRNTPNVASFQKLANVRGIEVTFFDPTDPAKLRASVRQWIKSSF